MQAVGPSEQGRVHTLHTAAWISEYPDITKERLGKLRGIQAEVELKEGTRTDKYHLQCEKGERNIFSRSDAFSKWPEVRHVSSTTTQRTIEVLQDIFATNGFQRLLMGHSPQQRSLGHSCSQTTSSTTSPCYITLRQMG